MDIHNNVVGRGFSLVEVMVVVAVIGIAGGLAVQGIATNVKGARARSERTALVLDVRTQKQRAVERLQPLVVRAPAADRLSFHKAVVTRDADGEVTGCTAGAAVAVEQYRELALSLQGAAQLCLDELGRPIDADVKIRIDADTDGDGAFSADERGTLGVSAAGVLSADGAVGGAVARAAGSVTDGAKSLLETTGKALPTTPLLPLLGP